MSHTSATFIREDSARKMARALAGINGFLGVAAVAGLACSFTGG